MTAKAIGGAPPSGFVHQVFRFGLVGVAGAVMDYGSLVLMVVLGFWQVPARAVSFILGSTTAYLLNRRWTFRSRRDTREVVSIAVVYGLTFLIVLVIYGVTVRLLPDFAWRLTVAWVLSQGTGTTFNFLAQRWLVFRS